MPRVRRFTGRRRDLDVLGDKALLKKLARFSGGVQRRIVRRPLSAALTPINKAAKRFAPVRTGALKKSIGKKVKMYRKGAVWGGVGPRVGEQYVVVEQVTGAGGETRAKRNNPSNYAHLVEFGQEGAPARPFLRPALDSKRGEAVGILKRGIWDNIKKENRKK